MSNSKLVDVTIWSPNCTKPRNGKINKIVLHHMAGIMTVKQCGEGFSHSSRGASSHYAVDNNGHIGQYVDEKNRAWCTGHQIDHQAVTIEVSNDKVGGEWHVSDKAIETTIALIADICKRNGITKINYNGKKSGNLLKHKWFYATACPGPYLGSKFPYIADEVNKLLASGSSGKSKKSGKTYLQTYPNRKLPALPSKGYLCQGDSGANVKRLQRFCNWYVSAGISVDGSFGPQTVYAVKKSQEYMGLTQDGSWGPKTAAKAKKVRK